MIILKLLVLYIEKALVQEEIQFHYKTVKCYFGMIPYWTVNGSSEISPVGLLVMLPYNCLSGALFQ